MIDKFMYKYHFLSNFAVCKIPYNGMLYRTAEAAFQAQKTLDKNKRRKYLNCTPSQAKKWGRCEDLRPDWEDIKLQIMYEVLKAKFKYNPEMREDLLATGDELLVEGNTWGDTYWGVCRCSGKGENHLGEILMRVRRELRDQLKLD